MSKEQYEFAKDIQSEDDVIAKSFNTPSFEDALTHRGLNRHPQSREFEKAIEDEYYRGFGVSDGGKTDFYDIGDSKDVDDLCEHWGLSFDEGNCLKAIVGIAKGSRHNGTNPLRDAKKLVHYGNRVLNRLSK